MDLFAESVFRNGRGVGGDDARGWLSGETGSRAVGIAAVGCTACEGEEEVMASGRAAGREDPGNSRRNAARSLDWDPISELHQGQRSDVPAPKGRTYDCT